MFTEEEAKTRVCPKTLHVWQGTGQVMRMAGSPCIGSGCMAWRRSGVAQFGETHLMPPSLMKPALLGDPDVIDNLQAWGKAQEDAGRVPASGLQQTRIFGVPTAWRDGETVTGYCGLGGKP